MPWFTWLAPQHDLVDLERCQRTENGRHKNGRRTENDWRRVKDDSGRRSATSAPLEVAKAQHHKSCDYCQHAPLHADAHAHGHSYAKPQLLPQPNPLFPGEKRAEIERLTAQIDVLEAATLSDAEDVRALRLRPKLRVWARLSSCPDSGWLWRMFERDRRM